MSVCGSKVVLGRTNCWQHGVVEITDGRVGHLPVGGHLARQRVEVVGQVVAGAGGGGVDVEFGVGRRGEAGGGTQCRDEYCCGPHRGNMARV